MMAADRGIRRGGVGIEGDEEVDTDVHDDDISLYVCFCVCEYEWEMSNK